MHYRLGKHITYLYKLYIVHNVCILNHYIFDFVDHLGEGINNIHIR